MDRRDFLKSGVVVGATLVVPGLLNAQESKPGRPGLHKSSKRCLLENKAYRGRRKSQKREAPINENNKIARIPRPVATAV